MTPKEIHSRSIQVLALSMFTLLLVSSSWAADHEKVLHVFQGRPGKYPDSGLIFDAAGNLYGTTSLGGHASACGTDSGCGIVFELTPNSSGWTYSVLHIFQGGQDGAHPVGSLVSDTAGNLYGATAAGGDAQSCAGGCGTVFELTPSGEKWTESVLYSFQGGGDAEVPAGGMVFDNAGNLYGATINGGTGCNFSCGTVFELSPGSGSGWTEKILYNFKGVLGNPDAAYPDTGLTIDALGNLYGGSRGGGAGPCGGSDGGCGTIFEVSPGSGGEWTESVLHRFQGSDGQSPSGVVFDQTGDLYGATGLGGSKSDCGTVFELMPQSSGKWTQSILERFTCNRDGGYPDGIVLDSADNIYGATLGANIYDGTIFKLALLSGGGRKFDLLYTFTDNRDGGWPNGVIIDSTSSHLFGTTFYGGRGSGTSGLGVVFEVTP
jgi:uncharacterized repeat protein (TIGR03803 family)